MTIEKRKKKDNREMNGLLLDVWEVKKSFVEMSPKSYLGLLDTLAKLRVPHELGEESLRSTRLGITNYATCSFFLWDVNYKVYDNSNCIWMTSKGVKGKKISNLVRTILGKEDVRLISKRDYRFPLYSIKEAIEDFCTVLFESVKSGNITDEELAGKYNVGPKTKNYTYKRRSCVEYVLITRQSTINSLLFYFRLYWFNCHITTFRVPLKQYR